MDSKPVRITLNELTTALNGLPNPMKCIERREMECSIDILEPLPKGPYTRKYMGMYDVSPSPEYTPTRFVSGVITLKFRLNLQDYMVPRWEPVQEIAIIPFKSTDKF